MHQPTADLHVLPLDGMPTPPPPTPTAADLVAAWCEGYAGTHRGEQPDPSVLKRVRGICRAVARDRTDLDSWRAAWRAALAAGRRGRYDVVAELSQQVVTTGRDNHYLTLAVAAQSSSLAGRLTRELGA